MGNKKSIHIADWPKVENKYLKQEEIKIVAQINGKVRAEIMIGLDMEEDKVKEIVLGNENITKFLEGQTIKRVIYVRNRLINIVV